MIGTDPDFAWLRIKIAVLAALAIPLGAVGLFRLFVGPGIDDRIVGLVLTGVGSAAVGSLRWALHRPRRRPDSPTTAP